MSMSEQTSFATFDEFWDYYVSVHQHPVNRALHVGGTLAGFALAGTGILLKKRSLLLLAPVVGYGASWIGHFFIEKNTPATFQHPVWSFMGDMKMIAFTFQGKMKAEIDRVNAAKTTSEPARETPAAVEPKSSTTADAN